MLRRFRLEEPESVDDTSRLLARLGESAKIYAGGTELLLAMKEGLIHYEWLINVKRVPGLDQVRLEDGVIRIGALATHRMLESNPILGESLPAFAEMERSIANVRVREVGTLGGNLCFAEPHADPGTLLMVLGARCVVRRASSVREVPMERFFVDAYEACLDPDEILSEILVPLPPARAGLCYLKFGYLQRPSVGVALLLSLQERSVGDARIAVGCVGPRPSRVEEAEELLRGKALSEASGLTGKAGEMAARASQAMSDLHGSAEYKEHMVRVLFKRAFRRALGQCLGREGGAGGSDV